MDVPVAANEHEITPLAKSSSVDDICRRVGLDLTKSEDKKTYRTMKDEAVKAWQRMHDTDTALQSHLRHQAADLKPFSFSQIDKKAFSDAMQEIEDTASAETSSYYKHARSTADEEDDNWLIRCMLWRTYRNRDKRNHRWDKTKRAQSGSSLKHCGVRKAAPILRAAPRSNMSRTLAVPRCSVVPDKVADVQNSSAVRSVHGYARRFDPVRDI